MLILTTIRRLAILLFVFLAWAPAAYAWSWPVQGPVLQPFSYDESHPYAGGQHRGIDIGAGALGETVVAPAAGTVSFAGTVPTNGKTVTIETADGYSVTLTHLGSIGAAKGAQVAEQDPVGTVGPSGTPEEDGPYVHLGIRVTADPNGYVDPLGLLPPSPSGAATDSGTTASQPAVSGASSATPAPKPASSAPKTTRAATSHEARPEPARSHVRTRHQERAQKPRSNARTSRPQRRPSVRSSASEQTSSSRRPVVEPVVPRPTGLDAGHELRPPVSSTQPRGKPSSPLPGRLCDTAEAVFALALLFAASRRRRRSSASSAMSAPVFHLARPSPVDGHVSRAA